MKQLIKLHDILGNDDTQEEVYVSDQKKRYYRAQNGYYTKTKGIFSFIQLIKNWEEIVGKVMAQNTIPLKIKSSTLIISVKHSIFAQELGFLTPLILEKIKAYFPELEKQVNKIKFIQSNYTSHEFTKNKKLKALGPIAKKPKMHPFSPEFLLKKSQAEDLFKDIEDEEVRNILKSFMLS
ncbi:MAG: DUF721 domain-containing protein [Halobacteriovoraceae bacterium]|nr:DUF721 domain-containing protein [Halobacteriovoraceae bacterium]